MSWRGDDNSCFLFLSFVYTVIILGIPRSKPTREERIHLLNRLYVTCGFTYGDDEGMGV